METSKSNCLFFLVEDNLMNQKVLKTSSKTGFEITDLANNGLNNQPI